MDAPAPPDPGPISPGWPGRETLLTYASILEKPHRGSDGLMMPVGSISRTAARALRFVAGQIIHEVEAIVPDLVDQIHDCLLNNGRRQGDHEQTITIPVHRLRPLLLAALTAGPSPAAATIEATAELIWRAQTETGSDAPLKWQGLSEPAQAKYRRLAHEIADFFNGIRRDD